MLHNITWPPSGVRYLLSPIEPFTVYKYAVYVFDNVVYNILYMNVIRVYGERRASTCAARVGDLARQTADGRAR